MTNYDAIKDRKTTLEKRFTKDAQLDSLREVVRSGTDIQSDANKVLLYLANYLGEGDDPGKTGRYAFTGPELVETLAIPAPRLNDAVFFIEKKGLCKIMMDAGREPGFEFAEVALTTDGRDKAQQHARKHETASGFNASDFEGMPPPTPERSDLPPGIWGDICFERGRQDEKFGVQNHLDGTGGVEAGTGDEETQEWRQKRAGLHKRITDAAEAKLTFRHILEEECAEAYAESDPVKLRAELVQVAAVVCAWIEALDRRPVKATVVVDEDEA